MIHAYFQCQYAEKENIEVVNQYLIEGESAHKGGRKKFQAAMDEAINLAEKSGETIALLMTEDDRYCRNMFHDSMLKFEKAKDAKQLELHLIYLNEIINYKTDPDRVIQFRIRRGMAEHESAKKSKKVKRTIKYKVDAGMFPGGLTPTGYLNEDKQILIDPKRAPFIKRIFKLFLTGKYSQSAITKLMRKEGFTVKTKKVRINGKLKKRPAKLITQSDIFRILREPFYFGKFYYMNSETNERELYPEEGIAKNYKPLFDDWKMFETVQKMLENEDRSKRQHKDENEEWAKFRGLITCGFCGCQLTPENSGNTWKNDSNRK